MSIHVGLPIYSSKNYAFFRNWICDTVYVDKRDKDMSSNSIIKTDRTKDVM
jgi:hypothetical protein